MVYTKRRPVVDRLMEKVLKTDGCWLWTGATCGVKQYGLLHVPKDGPHSSRLAHRIAYEIFVGPIPDGLEIDHLCCEPLCVNPAHLEPVNGDENNRRRAERRTHCDAGHELTPENILSDGRWGKKCKKCHSARTAAGARRRRAAAA